MNKIHKVVLFFTAIFTVGVTYAIFILKGVPEAFDWENEDE